MLSILNPQTSSSAICVSWSNSFPNVGYGFSFHSLSTPPPISTYNYNTNSFIQAAWTRRSRGEAAKRPSRKSWKQRTDMYMRPFMLDVFFSKRFIHAKVMHRGTSKVVSAASTNSKDLRFSLPSLTDENACRIIGNLIAERSIEADVFVMAYEPQLNQRIEGKIEIVIDTIKDYGILFV